MPKLKQNLAMLSIMTLFFSIIFTGCNKVDIPDFPNLSKKEIQRTCVGEVIDVQEATIQSNWGKILGAFVGGIVGNQFGGGTGKDVATVGGVVAGGYTGSQYDNQKNAQSLLIKIGDIKVRGLVKKKERLFVVGDKVEFKLANNEIIDIVLANDKELGCSNFVKSKNARMCNDLTRAGSNRKESHQVYLGNSFGEFDLEYETFTAKDRILVRYDNQILFDTGCVGTNGKLRKSLQYNGLSEEMTIEVLPNCMGNQPSTKWNFQLICDGTSKTKKANEFKTEVIVRGVMTEREYLNDKRIWQYKIEQLDTNTFFTFTSKNKIMYKDDLIEIKIIDGFVKEDKIKLLKRRYYEYKKEKEKLAKQKQLESKKVQSEQSAKKADATNESTQQKFDNKSNVDSVEELFGDDNEQSSNQDSSSVEELF
ncbi:MAG: glycine zipper 2TM domain-containing protein [Campylobacterota bacterium]|nr:glycine zipper 2TM domain-containing protein [Campylobacterota bacterium]